MVLSGGCLRLFLVLLYVVLRHHRLDTYWVVVGPSIYATHGCYGIVVRSTPYLYTE